MRIEIVGGLEGATSARGLAVVVDVLRAFTVCAYALAGGARESILVTEVEDALALEQAIPGSIVSAEVDGLPVEGVEISNSPTLLARHDLQDRTLIQRSSAGTQGVALAVAGAERVVAASLVVAAATARYVAGFEPALVTIVAMGETSGHLEDRACAEYIAGLLCGRPSEVGSLLGPLYDSDRYRRISAAEWPGFPPSDLDLALQPDRFDFAMPVTKEEGRLVVRRSPSPPPLGEGWVGAAG